MNRSEARNNAFILLFECSFQAEPDREEVLRLAEENHEISVDDFVLSLFHGVLDRREEIDAAISRLSNKRTLDRPLKNAADGAAHRFL